MSNLALVPHMKGANFDREYILGLKKGEAFCHGQINGKPWRAVVSAKSCLVEGLHFVVTFSDDVSDCSLEERAELYKVTEMICRALSGGFGTRYRICKNSGGPGGLVTRDTVHYHAIMVGPNEQIMRGVDQVTLSVGGVPQMAVFDRKSIRQETLDEAINRLRRLYEIHGA